MQAPADQIQHLVVLMLEGRSFDHMFGFMMDPDWPIDGLKRTESNPSSNGNSVRVTADAAYTGKLTPDPSQHFADVNMQIFGILEGVGEAISDWSRVTHIWRLELVERGRATGFSTLTGSRPHLYWAGVAPPITSASALLS